MTRPTNLLRALIYEIAFCIAEYCEAIIDWVAIPSSPERVTRNCSTCLRED